MYHSIMDENNSSNVKKSRSVARPSCAVITDIAELKDTIEALLADRFVFSQKSADVTLVCDSASITVCDRDGVPVAHFSRPFLFSNLRETVCDLVSTESKPAPRFSADAKTRTVCLGDSSVQLTKTEFRLFSALLECDGFLSTEALESAVWGASGDNRVAVYIFYLRRKLDKAFGHGMIITSKKNGYRLFKPDTQSKGTE